MNVFLLGTGGAIPTLRRSLPAVALQREGDIFLFDCGEGTQVQIVRAALSPGRLFAIFLTHLHGDHVTGLPGLLMTIMHQSREKPLLIFGPRGIKEYVNLFRKCLGFNPQYELDVREIGEGKFLSGPGYRMEAVGVEHKPLTLAYALIEEQRPGRFFPEKAEALGVTEGPQFGRLQRGEAITLDDGRVVSPEMVMGPPRRGRKFVYVTDTRPCPQVVTFAEGADVLIHEGMFAADMEEEAGKKGHCTAAQAAGIAREAHVDRLVITHVSSRYGRGEQLLEEARQVFPNTVIGRDLMELEIPVHKE
jgi:ribonuclease Z